VARGASREEKRPVSNAKYRDAVYQEKRENEHHAKRMAPAARRPTSSSRSRPRSNSESPRRRSTPSSSGNLGIRRAARNASVLNPTGGQLPIGITAGSGAAGLFFGAIAYALILSVVDYGPSGPLLWIKAKFLNQAAGSAPVSPNPAATPGTAAGPSTKTAPGTPSGSLGPLGSASA
jgi:hypothetical protein